jgi:hypothetical protein
MTNTRLYIVLTSVLVLLLATGTFLYISNPPVPQPTQEGTLQTNSITLTIQGLYENKALQAAPSETVLHVLQTLNAEDTQVQLITEEYAGLGTLVYSIHGNQNGTDQKYWQYNVNGEMPQISADKYTLTDGDIVEWFFGPSQE